MEGQYAYRANIIGIYAEEDRLTEFKQLLDLVETTGRIFPPWRGMQRREGNVNGLPRAVVFNFLDSKKQI